MGGRQGRTRRVPTAPRGQAGGAVQSTDDPTAVRVCLQEYAERGVFRGFTERSKKGRRLWFSFTWLARSAYDLTYEPETGRFVFLNVLPNVAPRSALAKALREFVDGRAASDLPPHRRIDPRRSTVSALIRQGTMRLQLVAQPGHHGYGANRIVNLVHEVYLFLSRYHPEYLWDHYGLPQD